MIKTTRDYYDLELKDRKGEILPLEELPIDLAFMTLPSDVQKSIVIPYLVNEEKIKLYLGVQANAVIIPTVIEKVGELKRFNDHKSKGPFVDTKAITKEVIESLKDIEDEEELKTKYKEEFDKIFQERANAANEEYKKEVAATTQIAEIKVVDDFMLVPQDIELKEYQKIHKAIDEEGYSVYSEKVFVEIL